ncbi:hypothetical protein KY284_020146 [Solanum tuberosum]|nr:hypothetical protein KY284_020146 [Solanum tuberosum]
MIAFLVWSETCNAKRGRHWRHITTFAASLYKKKGRNMFTNPPSKGYSATTNARYYGAKGDGTSDDT